MQRLATRIRYAPNPATIEIGKTDLRVGCLAVGWHASGTTQ